MAWTCCSASGLAEAAEPRAALLMETPPTARSSAFPRLSPLPIEVPNVEEPSPTHTPILSSPRFASPTKPFATRTPATSPTRATPDSSSASDSENGTSSTEFITSHGGVLSQLVRRALPARLMQQGAVWRQLASFGRGERLSKFQAALRVSQVCIVVTRTRSDDVFGCLLVSEDGQFTRDSVLWELEGKTTLIHRWAGGPAQAVIVHSGLRHWGMGLEPDCGLKFVGSSLGKGFSAACSTFGNTAPLCGQSEFTVESVHVWVLQANNAVGLLLSPQGMQFGKTALERDQPGLAVSSARQRSFSE